MYVTCRYVMGLEYVRNFRGAVLAQWDALDSVKRPMECGTFKLQFPSASSLGDFLFQCIWTILIVTELHFKRQWVLLVAECSV